MESLQENIGYWQESNPHESPVEQVATSPTKKKKSTRNRQKSPIQSDDASRQIALTTEEEIALAKGWVAICENIEHGNTRKKDGFWCEVLAYIESKTEAYGHRKYDMMCEKWMMVRPTVIRFFGVYDNVMRMAQESGAGDEDYVQRAMIHYQAETGLPFKFSHCWDVLKDSPKWKEITLPNFNTGSEGGNSTTRGRDKARAAEKNKGLKALGSSTINDDALARLMVTEMTTAEVQQREAFIEIKRREVECREREVAATEYRQQQEDVRSISNHTIT
ncbi:hypothetical protein Tco_1072513 [Tanacetum coccineum]